MSQTFRVGLTRDFLKPDGSLGYGDIGLGLLEERAGVEWEFLVEDTTELRPDQVRDYDALLVLTPRVSAETLEGADRLAIVARFGVGYDTVDVEACTRNGVLLTITPDAVRRPVAVAVMTFVLALSQKMLIKDRLTREGRWADKLDHMGIGLVGRKLGVVGLGSIGKEVCRLAAPFDLKLVASDPYVSAEDAASVEAELLDLDALMKTADFVCICAALTPETHGLISADRIALMRESAYLINMARGPIVDQQALTEALLAGRIQGAGTDVFETEPVDSDDPLLKLDNVIVTPHGICWTDEGFLTMGQSAGRSILEVAAGRVPGNVVNGAVADSSRLRDKLLRFSARGETR